eukprot:8836396-Lingulodinium_polyedra.AAC.1
MPHQIYTRDGYWRLSIHGALWIRGCERVLQLGSRVFRGFPLSWTPGQKFKDPKMSSLAGRVDIGARHTL